MGNARVRRWCQCLAPVRVWRISSACVGIYSVVGGESSSSRVKDKASLDNSGQFFLFKGKCNFPVFHCSVVASKETSCLSCNKTEILCFISLIPSVVNDASVHFSPPCVAVNGVSPSFLSTSDSCPLWSGLRSCIISCHLSKAIYKMSADSGTQAKPSFHEKTNSLEMYSFPASACWENLKRPRKS